MKKGFLFVISFFAIANFITAQPTNASLLKEVEKKLSSGTSISQILTEKKYENLHPDTDFRKLVESHCKADVISIAGDTIPGKRIRVIGFLKDLSGQPIADALVYLYQTDSRGWYAADAPHVQMNEGDMRHARLFGYVKTNKEGRFELHTIKPSGYPQSDLPAHIHIHFTKPGYRNYITELLFDDDPRLIGKIRENAISQKFIITKPVKDVKPYEQLFNYTLVMQKL